MVVMFLSQTGKVFECAPLIANLDLVTDAVENRVVSWASGAWARHLLMKVFGNLLVVLPAHIVYNGGRLTRHHEQGLYAFDLNDFSQNISFMECKTTFVPIVSISTHLL